jgi:hypothetical protein
VEVTKASLDDEGVVQRLCERIASGEGITEICQSDDMPAKTTVYARMASDEEFRTRIACAREAQQESEADHCVELADQATVEDWQVVKLKIWARQWRASKLAPKKYGDRLDLNHSGSIERLSDEQLDAKLAELLGKAGVAAAGGGEGSPS